ncbi:MAG: hypothetical protein CMO59_09300 [Verrucomicrobiales bacterium]|nr:hypothetical protein [Verrucomicrobiales bacterium]|tara:strand:- start:5935 stop:6540 length:606 start_codon:yes stop_codon:yes gene_type:complete
MSSQAPPPLVPFQHPGYLVRRKVFKLLGGAFHVFDPAGNVVLYSKQKAFKLKEDIRIYTGEDMGTEVLTIRTDQIIDLGATYHVHDSQQGGVRVGSLKRKGLKSMLRDEWVILDSSGQEVGIIQEDSVALALLRRLMVGWLLPQRYYGTIGNNSVSVFTRNFNPFISKISLDFSMDTQGQLDRRLGIAAVIMLLAIDGKQG